MTNTVPNEFEEIPPYGPYSEMLGPFYGCIRNGVPMLGVRIESKHVNKSQIMMHGGMLATLVDNAMIWAIRQLKPECDPCVTTQLSINFIGAIKIGDWVEARVTFVKHGRKLYFAECNVHVEDKIVGKVSGQFMPIAQ